MPELPGSGSKLDWVTPNHLSLVRIFKRHGRVVNSRLSRPGTRLAQYLAGSNLVDAAAKMGIGQAHHSNLVDGSVSIDANLANKLANAFETTDELWIRHKEGC